MSGATELDAGGRARAGCAEAIPGGDDAVVACKNEKILGRTAAGRSTSTEKLPPSLQSAPSSRERGASPVLERHASKAHWVPLKAIMTLLGILRCTGLQNSENGSATYTTHRGKYLQWINL